MHPHTPPVVPQIDYGGALGKGVITAVWMLTTMPGFWIAVTLAVLAPALQTVARARVNAHAVRNRSVDRRR